VPLVVTEGEKKTLAADQAGFPCVGISGVWSWQTKRPQKDGKAVGPRELIADMAELPWHGRKVFVAFDSDAASNDNVAWAEWHLADALIKLGAIVLIVRLPAGPPGPDGESTKVGLDDFLVVNGPDAFGRLLHVARPPAKPDFGDDRPIIVICTEEHEVNNSAVEALGRRRSISARRFARPHHR
jgi:putative DNA primase/helicase